MDTVYIIFTSVQASFLIIIVPLVAVCGSSSMPRADWRAMVQRSTILALPKSLLVSHVSDSHWGFRMPSDVILVHLSTLQQGNHEQLFPFLYL